MLGKTTQAISRYAQAHPGVGRQFGASWLFSEADIEKLRAVRPGRPRKRRRRAASAPAPAPAQEAVG